MLSGISVCDSYEVKKKMSPTRIVIMVNLFGRSPEILGWVFGLNSTKNLMVEKKIL
jgi:hypothetical protein